MQMRLLISLAAFCAIFAPNLPALQRPPEPCDQYEAAVRADPNNVDAAASLGRCSFRDYEMVAPGGDSTRPVFRSSWSTALRALRHAVQQDPTYTRAYRPLFNILFAETRDGCNFITKECGYVSPVLRDGDSVLTVPRAVRLNDPRVDTYEEVIRESQGTRRANLGEARALAERWANVAPNDPRPHEYLGQALLRLGDAEAAVTELESAARLGTPESRRALFWDRFEALVKSDRGIDAQRVLDEAAADPARDTARLRAYTIAGLNAVLGRYLPPAVDSARARLNRARLDSLIRSRPALPPPRPGFFVLLAKADTLGARRELARVDAELAPREGMTRFSRVTIEHLWSAEYHLALGDTAGAEARLAEIERAFSGPRFQFSVATLMNWTRPWLGRAWSLSGDLAAARGHPEEAVRMYRRVIGLWAGSDPDMRPIVEDARAKLNVLLGR